MLLHDWVRCTISLRYPVPYIIAEQVIRSVFDRAIQRDMALT